MRWGETGNVIRKLAAVKHGHGGEWTGTLDCGHTITHYNDIDEKTHLIVPLQHSCTQCANLLERALNEAKASAR